MEKLFLNDSYIKNFYADILDVVKKDDRIAVVLDRTAFYPEGGGQPSDTGFIGKSIVSYVYEEDDVIYHVVDKEPDCKTNIKCSIDWDRRFDHMQQHCGQHILSAAFENILKGATVGFHLGSEYTSVDIAIDSLIPEEALKIENMANNIVFQNLAVKYHYPKPEEISKFPLRKAPSVHENIRIVEVDGFDFSPCGGTHPKFTGDVGLIKIIRWEKYKNSIRVEFLCGRRALLNFQWKNNYINEISNILSSKDKEVLDSVKRCVSELNTANKEVKILKDKVLSYEASELYNLSDTLHGIKIVKQIFTGRDFKEITYLAGKIAKQPSAIALLGLKSQSAQMVFARSADVNIKINELFKEVIPLINGKGGGNPQSAQGGGPDISNLESALDSAYIILKNRYLK